MTITLNEYNEILNYYKKLEEGGNDGADIYEFEEYCIRLVEKYNKDIHILFEEAKQLYGNS